ncbi:hypothetical protein FA95DRAFT_1608835 [Auriscalpium vulgare]|uniref:Uncharacterized protein n=1 Tax=Auriscalpium vulgare TaxID=40419 RepID=A0ACB8RK67_9AGAM|nr:hypothetical protein FA95DRAFT_1608835 [Auriscalpium vulgare]
MNGQLSLSSDDALTEEHNLSQLDIEYLKLQTALFRNRTQRNALVFVGRLPPEILTRIFFIRAKMEPIHAEEPQRTLGWITVTHVCGHWRRVALACSSLWTDIRFDLGPEWTQEMFARAKQVPVAICDPHLILHRHQLNIVLKHIALGREINLNARLMQYHALPRALTAVPFPFLKTFTVVPELRRGVEWRTYFMPHDFLGGYAPQLRRLNLTQTQVSWSAPVLNTLQELRVQLPLPTQARPACADFLDALRRMSSLERLYIEHLPLETHAEPENMVDIVDMPRMAYLRIADTLSPCIHLLGHLSLPPSADIMIYLHASTDHPQPATFRHLFPIINSRIQGPGSPICSLAFESMATWKVTVTAARNPADRYGQVRITVDWDEDTDWDNLAYDVSEFVTTTCEGFRKHLDVLSVDMQPHIRSVATWWTIIQAASNVRVLSVAGSAADAFCATLTCASLSLPKMELRSVPSPTPLDQYLSKLMVLRLVRTYLIEEKTKVLASLHPDVQSILVNCSHQYAKWIRRRKEIGMPLHSLQLEQCYMSDEARTLLESVCGTMVIT